MNFSYFDQLQDSVVVIRLDRSIEYYNPSALGLFGVPQRKAKKVAHCYDLIQFDDPELFWMPEGSWGKKRLTGYREVAFTNAKGVRGRVQICIRPVKREQQKDVVWLVYLRDVSLEETLQTKYRSELEQKEQTIEALTKTQENLKRSYEALKAQIQQREAVEGVVQEQKVQLATRMAALGEMAAGVAHEINNPLAIIMGNVEQLKMMNDGYSLTKEDLERPLEVIENTVIRITKIIKSLRILARDDQHDPIESVSLKSIFDDVLELCVERFKSGGVKLELGSVPADLKIQCRPAQISQAVLTLLNNAYDAVEKVETKRVGLYVLDEREEKSVRVIVSDTGPGVPKDVAPRIFDPFFTTKEVGTGTGLGLSVAKRIIDAHGGVLELDNNSVQTRFVARLPKKAA